MENSKAFGTYLVLAALLILGGAYTAAMGIDTEFVSKTKSIQNFINNVNETNNKKEKCLVSLYKDNNPYISNESINLDSKIDKEDKLFSSLTIKNMEHQNDKIIYRFNVKNLSKTHSVTLSNPKANITYALDDVSLNVDDFEILTNLEKTILEPNEETTFVVEVMLLKDLDNKMSINVDASIKYTPIKTDKESNNVF